MSANLTYWLFAFVLMTTAVLIACRGIVHVRAGRLVSHMKHLNLACNLLIFFVVTYVGKVFVLGREVKTDWSFLDLFILRTHETFIAIMLITGIWARVLAGKYRDRLEQPTEADLTLRRKHKLLGKLAVTSAVCALFTAMAVLWVLFKHQG